MKNRKIEIGDLFLIPFEKKYAVCKVLWVSKRTKNVFSFVVKNKLANTKEDALDIANIEENLFVKIYLGVVNVFYTSIEKLKNGEWEIIGNQKLTKEESDDFQYHNIGGNLYKGDEYIRSLNVEEYKTIPKMGVDGYEAIDLFLKMGFVDSISN